MKQTRSSQFITTLSLVKSRQILDKLTHKISQIQSNRIHRFYQGQNSKVIQSIQFSSKKIQINLDSKIDENFNHILHSPTLMPYSSTKVQPSEKENSIPNSLSSLEGAKALMYQYWERNKKMNRTNQSRMTKTMQSIKEQCKLPQINYANDPKISTFIRAKEKEKQFAAKNIEQPAQEFHITLNILDFKCQNDGKQFLMFQKIYYKRWQEIDSIIKALEKFAFHYKFFQIEVHSKKIFQLIDKVKRGQKIIPHDLLNCCENAEEISEKNKNKSGIRFFGKKGTLRAIIKIQSQIRKWIQTIKYKRMLKQWKSACKIQSHYRSHLLYQTTKKKIYERQLQKLNAFNKIQQQFIKNYRKYQQFKRVKYEIHIPSHNLTDWQKISAEKYLQKQNSQLCRIFKIAQNNLLCETKIIYISPINLTKEIINYYRKLLELGTDDKIDHRLMIITPEHNSKLPINLSLTQHLLYSSKTLNKIKKLISNNYAYIVPSTPSNDYILLCNELNVPLYGSNPQKLRYLSTKSGCKNLLENLTESKQEGFGVLPYSVDIYNESNLLNQLTNLIYRYPFVKKWILKIDNELNSRGLAHIDISKIINKKLLNKINNDPTIKSQQKVLRQQVYNILENILVVNKDQRIIPVDKEIYCNQSQFLKHYFTRGGIIEASINNFQTELQNTCFTVEVEPDGEWKFLCNYYKLTNKHKAVAAYYDSKLTQPPLLINNVIQSLKKRKLFGYFTLQFLSILPKQKNKQKQQQSIFYLNSIQCHLNEYSSAHYLKNFISKDSNTLYIPLLQHPCVSQLRLQTFFHLCRLQNISFDIEKKVGNVFTFMDGLQCGCIGIMTFNPISKQDCFTHAAEVLDFLNSKLKQTLTKGIPETFFSIKNTVNGYLNRNKKIKQTSMKNLHSNNC